MNGFIRLFGVIMISFSIVGLGRCSSDPAPSLKEALEGKFYIGTALNVPQILEKDPQEVQLITSQFNSITAENIMKSQMIQPEEGKFDFMMSDRFVEFGEAHDMKIIGHTLIWHSQLPQWFCKDENGDLVSPEVLKERMKDHIFTIVGRYKGRIHGWDVVNEAFLDDGSFRESEFYQILGEDYLRLAFEYAAEADPEAELYYNDYSMAQPGKRQGVVNWAQSLLEQGVKIDGIGMQGHLNMDYPSLEEFEKSIVAFSDLGLQVMITEMDLAVLPMPDQSVGAEISATAEYQEQWNPYTEGLPFEVESKQNQRFVDFFELFIKHHAVIDRVTMWGVNDSHSWKNNWPVKGRTDYPLLFDRNFQPKPAVSQIIEIALKD